MKKLLASILIISLVMGLVPAAGITAASKTDTEYERAVSYGFVPETLKQAKKSRTITWKEYCGVVYNVLTAIDKKAAKKWKKDAKRALKSNEKMKIYQGALVLYRASSFVGEDHVQTYNGNVGFLNPFEVEVGNDWEYDDFSEYAGNNDEWTYADEQFMGQDLMYRSVALLYGFNRASYVTFESLIPVGKLPGEWFTVSDAIHSAVRFYESREDFAKQYWLDKITQTEEMIDKDVAEIGIENASKKILESETGIVKSDIFIPGKTYTGTAYYVSDSGDDDNSGMSPQEAWKTLGRVEKEGGIQPGDAVFFERGCIFRGTLVKWLPEKVTYSAYGTGAKPVITTSVENSAREECWKLYYEKDGVKIWKYYKDMMDCGSIIFNDRAAGNKVLAKWSSDKNAWLDENGKKFSVKKGLTCNLDFFSDDAKKFNASNDIGGFKVITAYGPLYLRCDEGNPGSIFDDIEICSICEHPNEGHDFCGDTVDVWENCVIDNLSIKYYPMFAVSRRDGQVIQNCEFAWGGGCVQIVENGKVKGRAGDALCGGEVNDITIRNNYFHDLYSHGFIMEECSADSDGIDISSNVFERCCGLTFTKTHTVSNLTVKDNLFVGPGTGWGGRSEIRSEMWNEGDPVTAIIMCDAVFKDSSIEGNIFYYPLQFALIEQYDPEGIPRYAKNIFYLTGDNSFLMWWNTDAATRKYDTVFPGYEKSFLKNDLKDKTSKVIRR